MAAGLGFKEFTTGDVLTAADANGYLASQVVMVFASAAARTSAIASPQEGMISYLKDTNSTEYYSGSAWVAIGGGGASSTVAAFSDQKAANTQGGTFTAGAWRTRDINTTVGTNGISGASIASNQITLGAGTYLIQGSAPAYDVNQHMTRLYNITDSTVAINGGSAYTDATDTAVTHSPFSGVVVIAGSKVFEVQHYAGTTAATYGFGIAANNGSVETYTQITILKVA
jgi:hypothetical protein